MSNETQVTYWNEVAGPKWVGLGGAMEARLEAIDDALLAACAARPGDAVLDIGCGTGVTALRLADAVAPGGRVVGIDVSTPMLAVARRHCTAAPAVSFLQADAQEHDFGAEKFDLLASRFGVMFFADPVAAFANLRGGLAPGGRLCFVCWAGLDENPHWRVPYEIVAAAVGPPAPKPAHAPGPMAFSDAAYLRGVLAAAGFAGIVVTPRPVDIIGVRMADEAGVATLMGPAGALLDEKMADAATRERLADEIAVALRRFDTPDGPRLPATVYVVTAI